MKASRRSLLAAAAVIVVALAASGGSFADEGDLADPRQQADGREAVHAAEQHDDRARHFADGVHGDLRGREHETRLRRPVPEQRAAPRGRSGEPAAHDRELERLRLVLRRVLHDVRRRSDVVDGKHVDRAAERARPDRQRSRDGVRHKAPSGASLVAELFRQPRLHADVPRRPRRLAVVRRRSDVVVAGDRRPGRSAATWIRRSCSTTRSGSPSTTTRPRDSTAGRTSRGRSSRRRAATSSAPRSSSRTATTAASTGRRRRRSPAANASLCPLQVDGSRLGSATRTSSRCPRSGRTERSMSRSRTRRIPR